MEVFEAIRTLLSVRSYQDRPVPEESIRRILEAGRLTGSAKNGQPWQFVVVQDRETLQRLGELVRSGAHVAQAPLAIAVAIEKTPFAVSDASRAIQSMLMTAWADGLGSNWVGFAPMTEVGALLNVPENMEVLALLPIGYPAQAVGQGKKQRKDLSEIAHRERFGRPFE